MSKLFLFGFTLFLILSERGSLHLDQFSVHRACRDCGNGGILILSTLPEVVLTLLQTLGNGRCLVDLASGHRCAQRPHLLWTPARAGSVHTPQTHVHTLGGFLGKVISGLGTCVNQTLYECKKTLIHYKIHIYLLPWSGMGMAVWHELLIVISHFSKIIL